MPLPVEPWSRLVRLTDTGRAPEPFELAPDAAARAALAERLEVTAVRKLRFAGKLIPEGARDWRLVARLGATTLQPCGVTLAPVTTRIDEPVLRRYLAFMPEPPEGSETEMPADETAEALPKVLDLGAVMAEALALALPAFARAEGAELGARAFAEPGRRPMTDEEARPFAGLKRLVERGRNGS